MRKRNRRGAETAQKGFTYDRRRSDVAIFHHNAGRQRSGTWRLRATAGF